MNRQHHRQGRFVGDTQQVEREKSAEEEPAGDADEARKNDQETQKDDQEDIVCRLQNNAKREVFPLMFAIGGLQVVLLVMASTLGASMLADVVESREVVTGRREEGSLVAFQTLVFKATSGLGAFVAGLVLEYIAFPLQAAPGEVSPDVLFNLALIYGPVMIGLGLVSIAVLLFYRIDRATHEANVETLRGRAYRSSAAASSGADA